MDSNTVSQLCHDRFGFAIGNGPARFQMGGWFDVGESDCPCPACDRHLWGFRKPYASADKTYFFWALVCSCCKTALEPRELSPATKKKLYAMSTHRPEAVAAGPASVSFSRQDRQALTCKPGPDRVSRHGMRAAHMEPQDLVNEDGNGGWTYLLLSELVEVYLGATKNLRKRFRAHNGPSNGRFTGGRRWHLLAVRKFETRAEAFDEEARMKTGGYGKSAWKVACIPRALQLIARYGYDFNPYHWQYNHSRSMERRRQRERERKDRSRAPRARSESKSLPATGRTTHDESAP